MENHIFFLKFREIFTHLRHIIQNVHNIIHVTTCDLHVIPMHINNINVNPLHLTNNGVKDGPKTYVCAAWLEDMQSLEHRAFRVNNLSPTIYAKCKAFNVNQRIKLHFTNNGSEYWS